MQPTILASNAERGALGAGSASGASWGAIFAGAAAAAALSLVLFILGTGLGFATTSPWANHGADASTVGITSIVWVFATQIVASALGGYLAGRLRVKWPDAQTDEIFFRDTAHGLLTWAVASLFTAALLGSAISNALNSGVHAGAAVVSAAGQATGALGADVAQKTMSAARDATGGEPQAGQGNNAPLGYFVGNLFRGDQPAQPMAPGEEAAAAREALSILAYSLRAGQLRPEDKARLGQLVARQTGLSQEEAEKRAAEIYYRASTEIANAEAAAKDAADKARKAAAHISLWFFVALLCGAFCASYTATIGGRQRDTWGG